MVADLAVFGAVHGQDDEGDLAPGPDALADLETVEVGQPEVEHDHVRPLDGGLADSLLAGFGAPDGVTEGLQRDAADAEQAWIVVNDENSRQPDAPRMANRSPGATAAAPG